MEFPIRTDDRVDIFVSKFVLILSGFVPLARVDEEYVSVVALSSVEDEDCRRDARSEEEICRKPDNGFEEVFFDGFLTDFPFARTSKENAVRNDYAHLSVSFVRGFDHVADKRPVAFALRRNAAPKTVVFVSGGVIGSPLVQRERRIRYDGIEFHEPVALFEFGIVDGIAPADGGIVEPMEEHIHDREGPSASVGLLSVKGEVFRPDFAPGFDKQRTRSARRIANARSRLAFRELGDERGNLWRREKFSGLLSGVAREIGDEVFVGVTDNVRALSVGTREIQILVGKVGEKVLEPDVLVFRLAEVVAIEIDASENSRTVFARKLFPVRVFKIPEGDIDEFSDVRFVTVVEQVIERGMLGHYETFVLHRIRRAFGISVIFFEILAVLVLMDVADVFQEEHREHVIFVRTRIDDSAESIASLPDGLSNFVRGDFSVHSGFG